MGQRPTSRASRQRKGRTASYSRRLVGLLACCFAGFGLLYQPSSTPAFPPFNWPNTVSFGYIYTHPSITRTAIEGVASEKYGISEPTQEMKDAIEETGAVLAKGGRTRMPHPVPAAGHDVSQRTI